MTTVPLGRSMWLLARLRMQRIANMTGTVLMQSVGGGKSRKASKGKTRMRWTFAAIMALMMAFVMINMSRQAVANFHCHLDHQTQCTGAKGGESAISSAARHIQSAPFSEQLSRALTMQMALLLAISALAPLGARESSNADWDLEWLVTLPIPTSGLMWARLFERSLVNPAGWAFMWPAVIIIAWDSGLRWTAPLLAAAATFVLLSLGALARTLVDTGLRMKMGPAALRNLFATISMVAVLLLYFVLSFSMAGKNSLAIDFARAIPAWLSWTPPGLVVQAINSPNWWQGLLLAALLLAQTALLLMVGVQGLQHLLRKGVVGAGARESARVPAASGKPGSPTGWRIGTPIQRRELRLLGRDRNFMVQTLVLPVLIIGGQLYFNGHFDLASAAAIKPSMIAMLAFGISAYMLMLSAFQTLHTEGPALWMLYTFPRSMESILREKAILWGVLSLGYPLIVFGACIALKGALTAELAVMALMVFAGLPIYAVIAVALGVFGTNPLAQAGEPRAKISYLYLYMLLMSLYMYAILAGLWVQKVVMLVLVAALALSLWQKARDELPYLLDPAESPPKRVSLSDGMIAALMFFVLQGLFALLAHGAELTIKAMFFSFALAGAITYVLLRYSFWRLKFEGVPRIFGGGKLRSIGLGAASGIVAALIGLAYTAAAQHFDLFQITADQKIHLSGKTIWAYALVVMAAPLFEEFIFRGLIFGGLRRSLGVGASVLASAAVFACVHPPFSMLPVFALGVCTALAYERSKSLLAPMVTHAVYNGAIIAALNLGVGR